MKLLSKEEINVLILLSEGNTYKNAGHGARHYFMQATSKLRNSAGCFSFVEGNVGCDYSLEWFRAHKEETMKLIERYQDACHKAYQCFYACRCGEHFSI